jgi:dihydrofolate reductase
MDENRLIGANNRLPWHLPDDVKRFKNLTMGKPVIMGRQTYESIPQKFRPLTGRHNIVLTGNRSFRAPGCTVVHSIEEALAAAGECEEVMIGGGARLYEQLLPRADRIYLTLIEATLRGDTYFPQLNLDEWNEVLREVHQANERNAYRTQFIILERIKNLA